MEPIYLPKTVDIESEEGNTATFSIYPYHPGYGPTLANALRRVLLSSLPGAAITHMKIDGVDHEFSTLEGVKEDMVALMLNLKRVKVSSTSENPIEISLDASGEGVVTAKDFTTSPEVEVANPEQEIATLTSKNAKLKMYCTVEQGRGYVASDLHDKADRDIGTIAIDATFTPVERVNFEVSDVRVGQATNYHKLALTVTTNGTVQPIDAIKQAASVLKDHFEQLAGDFEETLTSDQPQEEPEIEMEVHEDEPENTLSKLKLSSRVHNALERVGITTVEQVLELSEEQIQDVPGLGQKAIEDIMEARERVKQELGA